MLFLGKIRLKKGGGAIYTVCGLDIGCGWCVDMSSTSETVDTRKYILKKIA